MRVVDKANFEQELLELFEKYDVTLRHDHYDGSADVEDGYNHNDNLEYIEALYYND